MKTSKPNAKLEKGTKNVGGKNNWIYWGLDPKSDACKASTLPLMYHEIMWYCLSLKNHDHNFTFVYSVATLHSSLTVFSTEIM